MGEADRETDPRSLLATCMGGGIATPTLSPLIPFLTLLDPPRGQTPAPTQSLAGGHFPT